VIFAAALASFALLMTGAPNLFAEAGGFQGIFAHKNTLGLRMNILIAGACILLFTTRGRIAWLAALILGGYLLMLSKSATSQILGLITPAALIGIAILKLNARQIALCMAGGVGLAAGGLAILLMAGGDAVTFVLDSFGKDSTLTGRTWIWARGMEEIAKHPILGGGYQAFWANERSSEVMWIRHITLESVKGFHNVWVEVWNDLGIPGIVSLVAVLLWYARRVFRFHLLTPSADGLFPVFLLPIIIISASMNNSFFRQHEMVHILLCAFFAATWLPRGTQRRRPRHVR
ncbi:MAG: O-antigen ligase family protein, partial [Oricola sp.]|nr:O-antigen ligase family protein [Oricola sp.]